MKTHTLEELFSKKSSPIHRTAVAAADYLKAEKLGKKSLEAKTPAGELRAMKAALKAWKKAFKSTKEAGQEQLMLHASAAITIYEGSIRDAEEAMR